jgi:crotonobetaine/carnitine-CoA ligase
VQASVSGNGTTAGQSPDATYSVVGERTLPTLLREGAARHPSRLLLVFEDDEGRVSTFTWSQVLGGACAVAEYLRAFGVGPGDRVHVHLPNRPEFLFAWFAIAELGASMVPTNTASSTREVAFATGHARVTASVADSAGIAVVRNALAQTGSDVPIVVCEDAGLLDLAPAEPRPVTVRTGDELGVLYTSGTTSRPKGVQVTHANYIFAGETYAAAMRLTREDRLLTVLPLFHANAQYYSTMGALVSDATLVLTSRFSATRWVGQAIRHEATVANLFAAPIRMLLAQEPQPEWRQHSLRAVMFAQNLAAPEVRRWENLIGAPLVQGYGMTETIGPPLMNPVVGRGRPDAVGRPTLPYTCRLVREDGTTAAPGEPGELLVGGTPGISLMAGYLDDPDATAAVLKDGWLRTGDVLRVDPDGLFSFVDRRKDMIKRAGENVAASEIEAVLLDHAAVLDAAVVGVPDPIRDEDIVAFVVADGAVDGDELIGWCRARLAKFRVPGAIEIVDELPRTAVGKIQKHVLRARWLALQPSSAT